MVVAEFRTTSVALHRPERVERPYTRKLSTTAKIYESQSIRAAADDGASLIARRKNVANSQDPLPCKYCIELPLTEFYGQSHALCQSYFNSCISNGCVRCFYNNIYDVAVYKRTQHAKTIILHI